MDYEESLPDECPVCKKVKTNLLLHIQKSEPCNGKVDPDLYIKWKSAASKRKKRKYQEKYRVTGKAREASKKFYKKRKQEDKDSFQKIQNRDWNKFWNREEIHWNLKKVHFLKKMSKKKARQKRLKKFNKFCSKCYYSLSRGHTPSFTTLNSFHLVEADFDDRFHEEILDWLKGINGRLLRTLIQFQQLALLTKSRWLAIMQKVKNQKNENFLFRILGKLQAYENENTKEIQIPDQFKSTFKTSNNRHDNGKKKIAKDDEEDFIILMADILIDQERWKDEELWDLLRITKPMMNLNLALTVTIN